MLEANWLILNCHSILPYTSFHPFAPHRTPCPVWKSWSVTRRELKRWRWLVCSARHGKSSIPDMNRSSSPCRQVCGMYIPLLCELELKKDINYMTDIILQTDQSPWGIHRNSHSSPTDIVPRMDLDFRFCLLGLSSFLFHQNVTGTNRQIES